jgi:hypothetical protein
MSDKKILSIDQESHNPEYEQNKVISVNGRNKLDKIRKAFPNMPIIIGKANENDRHVPMNLAEMDHQRNKIIDAATTSVMGERIDTLEKPRKFPWPVIVASMFFMIGVGSCYLFYNMGLININ